MNTETDKTLSHLSLVMLLHNVRFLILSKKILQKISEVLFHGAKLSQVFVTSYRQIPENTPPISGLSTLSIVSLSKAKNILRKANRWKQKQRSVVHISTGTFLFGVGLGWEWWMFGWEGWRVFLNYDLDERKE